MFFYLGTVCFCDVILSFARICWYSVNKRKAIAGAIIGLFLVNFYFSESCFTTIWCRIFFKSAFCSFILAISTELLAWSYFSLFVERVFVHSRDWQRFHGFWSQWRSNFGHVVRGSGAKMRVAFQRYFFTPILKYTEKTVLKQKFRFFYCDLFTCGNLTLVFTYFIFLGEFFSKWFYQSIYYGFYV